MEMDKWMTRLRAERLRRGWRLDDLAHHSRLSSSDISKLETGRLRPSPTQLQRLARVLRTDAASLMDRVEMREATPRSGNR